MPIATNAAGDALYLDDNGAWQPAQTAQNPQTGAKLAFDGQSWAPLAPGSDPNYTMGDVGDAALRGVPIAGGLYERNESPENQARAQNFDAAHPYISGAAKARRCRDWWRSPRSSRDCRDGARPRRRDARSSDGIVGCERRRHQWRRRARARNRC
jgi:hypothetical protein